jgi:hypothetical protein
MLFHTQVCCFIPRYVVSYLGMLFHTQLGMLFHTQVCYFIHMYVVSYPGM